MFGSAKSFIEYVKLHQKSSDIRNITLFTDENLDESLFCPPLVTVDCPEEFDVTPGVEVTNIQVKERENSTVTITESYRTIPLPQGVSYKSLKNDMLKDTIFGSHEINKRYIEKTHRMGVWGKPIDPDKCNSDDWICAKWDNKYEQPYNFEQAHGVAKIRRRLKNPESQHLIRWNDHLGIQYNSHHFMNSWSNCFSECEDVIAERHLDVVFYSAVVQCIKTEVVPHWPHEDKREATNRSESLWLEGLVIDRQTGQTYGLNELCCTTGETTVGLVLSYLGKHNDDV